MTVPIALLIVGGACKDKADGGKDKKSSAKPQPKPPKDDPTTRRSSPSIKPLLDGHESLDRRPGPRHQQRMNVADKLSACLLATGTPAEDCFVETVRSESVDAVPPSVAVGKDAVSAWMASGFGLGLTDVTGQVAFSMVKGAEALFLCHVQGTADGTFLGAAVSKKPVGLSVAFYVRYDRSGKILEVQAFVDQLSALGQVGGTTLAYRSAVPAFAGEKVYALASGYGSEAKNLQVFQDLTDELDEHDPERMKRFYRPEAVLSRVWQPADFTGLTAIADSYGTEFKGSSNSRYTVKWEWVAQDHVAMLIERSGTSTGPLLGGDTATNRSYTLRELHVMRLRGRLTDKHWIFSNALKLASEIGAVQAGAQ